MIILWFTNKPIVIPFLLLDSSNNEITQGVSPYVIICRMSDNQYYNSSTAQWQPSSYNIPLVHSYGGIWTYTFIPTQEDTYICKCVENTYLIKDGITITTDSRLNNLSNLDALISSRLPSSSYVLPDNATVSQINNKINIIDTIVDDIQTNVDIIDSKVDVTVSSRSTLSAEDVWRYSNRSLSPTSSAGVGQYEINITCIVDGVVASGINVVVFNDSRAALFQATSDSNGNVTLFLDSGNYYFDYSRNDIYNKEIQQNVNSNLNLSVDLIPISDDSNINLKFRELSIPQFEIGTTVKIGIEAYCDNNKNFIISSGTTSVTGVTENINCEIIGKKIYALCPINQTGWVTVRFSILVRNQTFGYEIKRYVD